MTREAIEYFKFYRKIFCEDHLKNCPKDSIAYQATLREKEFYDMAIKALEQEPKRGHWIFTKTIFDKHGCTVECSSCHKKWKTYDEIRWKKENNFCPNCGADMREV